MLSRQQDPGVWARFNEDSDLLILMEEMLKRKIEVLMGAPTEEILSSMGQEVSKEQLMRLAHVAILQANEAGKPAGQMLSMPTKGSTLHVGSLCLGPSIMLLCYA